MQGIRIVQRLGENPATVVGRSRTAKSADLVALQEADGNRTRAARRRMFYGIELGQLEALLDRQGGVCAVCDRPLSLRSPVRGPQPDTACLDHDHACCPGKRTCGLCVRGLLCVGCNVKVGYWERGQGTITERGSEYLQNGPVDFAAFS